MVLALVEWVSSSRVDQSPSSLTARQSPEPSSGEVILAEPGLGLGLEPGEGQALGGDIAAEDLGPDRGDQGPGGAGLDQGTEVVDIVEEVVVVEWGVVEKVVVVDKS